MISTAAMALAMSLPLSLQGAGNTAVAITNDNPETWSVEYPRLIRPYVVRYRNCLGSSNRVVTGEANFEAQHASDLPRCAETEAEAKANALEAMRGAKTAISAEELETLFRNIGQIHIARGRDFDNQFMQLIKSSKAARANYEENRPKGW